CGPQAGEPRGGRVDQMRRAEHVAPEVEHHVVALAVARGREEPRALVLLRQEILSELDLTEILRVVESHARPPQYTHARPSVSSDPDELRRLDSELPAPGHARHHPRH